VISDQTKKQLEKTTRKNGATIEALDSTKADRQMRTAFLNQANPILSETPGKKVRVGCSPNKSNNCNNSNKNTERK